MALQLESVRLVHSQGLLNHYIANQLYQPTDDGHRSRGTFLILLEQKNTPNGSFVGSAITTLIRDYYRPGSPVGLDGFEHSLLRLNERLRQGSTEQKLDMHGLIALFYEDEIHLSYLGDAHGHLLRDGQVLPLTDKSEKPSDETSLAFSLITSGELKPEDVLVMSCSLSASTLRDWDESLLFASSHTPTFETGRALARILLDRGDRDAEALLVRFSPDISDHHTVALDKSLETSAEKLEKFHSLAKGMVGQLGQHAQKLKSASGQVMAATQRTKPEAPLLTEPLEEMAEDVELESLADEKEAIDQPNPDIAPDEPKILVHNEQDDSAGENFAVTTYWQRRQAALAKERSTSSEDDGTVPEEVVHTTTHFTIPFINKTVPTFKLGRIKPRTLYLLVGTFVLLFVVAQIYNSVTTPNMPETTTAQRDTLIAQAEASAREADAAQAQDDTATAIEKLLATQTALSGIPANLANEKSKALATRAKDSLAKLTKAVVLTADATVVTSTEQTARIVSPANSPYSVSTTGTIYKIDGAAAKLIETPKGTVLDATTFADNKKIALFIKTSDGIFKIYQIDTNNDSVKEIVRSDSKPWPDGRLISSFESNLYIAGAKITKAIPSNDKYRIVTFANDTATDNLTSFTNNGSAFYGVEGNKQIVRLAANSPKTPIKPFGVPDSFWPEKITRLMSSGKEGQLFMFDATGSRILQITTDGGYQKQYQLPTSDTYADCNPTTTGFACVTNQKQIKTFTLPQS